MLGAAYSSLRLQSRMLASVLKLVLIKPLRVSPAYYVYLNKQFLFLFFIFYLDLRYFDERVILNIYVCDIITTAIIL